MSLALRAIVALTIACGAWTSASAQSGYLSNFDGGKLWELCNGSQGAIGKSMCAGYIIGAVDQLEISRAISGSGSCVPEGADPQTLVRIVENYLKYQTKDHWRPAAAIVKFALIEVHPACER